MKVLMFGWEFPPYISGGLGVACHGISSGLAENNVQVKFVIPSKKGKQIEDNFIELIGADEIYLSKKYKDLVKKSHLSGSYTKKIRTPYYTSKESISISENINLSTHKGGHSLLGFSGNYGVDLQQQVSRYSIIGEVLGLEGDFDIIHAHDWLTFLAGVSAKKVSKKPLIVHIHATEFDRSGDNYNKEVYDIEKHGMELADKVVAVSHYTKSIIVNKYGIHPDKIEVLHNAIDKKRQFERLHTHNNLNSKIVLFLGRITMQKGPDYFIEAARLVLQKVKNVHFVMAGSGDMMTSMITKMAGLKIADRFHFTGFLDRMEVEKIYAMSSVYVMPSVSEPFGLTAFEALLHDVPIIISKQSGVKELLRDAITIDFWDVQKLVNMIVILLKDEKLAKAVVKKCKDDIRNIEWRNNGAKLRNIYTALTA